MPFESLAMKSLLASAIFVALLGFGPAAMAQQKAMTAYGPVRNYTTTPEWREAGGNPVIYQRILREKLRVAQEKAMKPQIDAMIRQQKAYDKWLIDQHAKLAKKKPVDPDFQRLLDEEARIQAVLAAQAAAKQIQNLPPSKRAAAVAKKKREAREAEAAKRAAEEAATEEGDDPPADEETEQPPPEPVEDAPAPKS